MNHPETPLPHATITLAGVRDGMAQTLPFTAGLFIFAMALGAVASQKGLTFAQTVGQSAIVYAGASQMLTLQIWPVDWTLSAVLAAAGVTAAVNSRFLLMGATLRPWIAGLDWKIVYGSLFFLTDASFAIGARHAAGGGRDYGLVLGAHVPLYLGWVATTALGYLGGALIAQPERWGLDLILPLLFTTMAVPMIRRAGRIAPFAIAGLVAIVTSWLAPGWFIVIGALAGALSAALLGDEA
jgi:predicted branched-subunit amino acid permease